MFEETCSVSQVCSVRGHVKTWSRVRFFRCTGGSRRGEVRNKVGMDQSGVPNSKASQYNFFAA